MVSELTKNAFYSHYNSSPAPARPRTAVWGVTQRAEPLSRLHLSPSKGISFFILNYAKISRIAKNELFMSFSPQQR